MKMLELPADAKPTAYMEQCVAHMTGDQADEVFLVLGAAEKSGIIGQVFFDLISEPQGAAEAVVRELAAIFLSK